MATGGERTDTLVEEEGAVAPTVVLPKGAMASAEDREDAALAAVEEAKALTVESPDDVEYATDLVREWRAAEKQVEDALAPYIDPLRTVLDRLYALRREPQRALKRAQNTAKKKIQGYHRKVEEERRRKEEAARRKAEEEARRRREEAALEAAEEDDEERFEAIARHMEDPAPADAGTGTDVAEPEPGLPKGSYEQVRHKARLAGDTDQERAESLRKLMRAILDPEVAAPLSLVQLNESKANELAKATDGELRLPGLECYEDRTLVVRS